ncbi:MAG: hypothetical protein ABFD50_11495 [Smithella sp.]
MSDISSIASSILAMRQTENLNQISLNILKMNTQAEAAMADILMENARQIQSLPSSSNGGVIDIYV